VKLTQTMNRDLLIESLDEDIASSYTQIVKNIEDQKRRRKIEVIVTVVGIYSILGSLFALSLYGNDSGTAFQLFAKNDSKSTEQVKLLEARILELEARIASSTDGSIALQTLKGDIIDLRKREEALEQTLMMDAGKAISTALLNQQQKSTEQDIQELKGAVSELNERIFQLVMGMIAVPVLTALLAFVGWYLQRRFFNNGESSGKVAAPK
jgi:cell division protein FtsB